MHPRCVRIGLRLKDLVQIVHGPHDSAARLQVHRVSLQPISSVSTGDVLFQHHAAWSRHKSPALDFSGPQVYFADELLILGRQLCVSNLPPFHTSHPAPLVMGQ